MSSEQSINIKSTVTPEIEDTIKDDLKKIQKRVDINDLLFKIREKEKVQRKENLLFFCLIASVIVITGIIASL
jgi:hypothetical protein|tara:strand:- start:241 stop:459 length:219 start_codon:yes stop_codon:yes gene_type:complete